MTAVLGKAETVVEPYGSVAVALGYYQFKVRTEGFYHAGFDVGTGKEGNEHFTSALFEVGGDVAHQGELAAALLDEYVGNSRPGEFAFVE